jgi:hypothetical protein
MTVSHRQCSMAEKQYRGFVKGAQWAANPIWIQVGVNVGKFPMQSEIYCEDPTTDSRL